VYTFTELNDRRIAGLRRLGHRLHTTVLGRYTKSSWISVGDSAAVRAVETVSALTKL